MERQQRQHVENQKEQQQEEVQISSRVSEVDQVLLDDTDDLLAEIDGLLEENAEDFVRGFVQKGGE